MSATPFSVSRCSAVYKLDNTTCSSMQLTCGRWYLPNKDPVQCRYPHGGGSGGDDDVNVGGSGEDDGDGTADGGGEDDGVDDAL